MVSSAAITIAALLVAQSADDIRLRRGEEFVYRGGYTETATHGGKDYQRSFALENRIFVCAVVGDRFELAAMTTLTSPTASGAAAVRFAMLTADSHGRVRLKNSGCLPFIADGPPSLDCAALIEQPADNPETWTASNLSPPFVWRRIGFESGRSGRCLKLVGTQESDNWERISGDRPGWRRRETAWVSALNGVVERLERESEWRRIGERDSVVKSTTVYELSGGVSIYPDALGNDRQTEIRNAVRFQQELRQLLAQRGQPERFERLMGRIDAAVSGSPATPFRPAVLAIRQQADAARRGDMPNPDAP